MAHSDVSDVASGGRTAHCDPGWVEPHRARGEGIVELMRDIVESVSDVLDDGVRRVRAEEGVLERDLERVVHALSVTLLVGRLVVKEHVRLQCLLREPVLRVARVTSGCEFGQDAARRLTEQPCRDEVIPVSSAGA